MRLCQADRNMISKLVLAHAFEDRCKALDKEAKLLGLAVYANIIGPYERKLKGLPRDWVSFCNDIDVRLLGQYHTLPLPKPRVFPARGDVRLDAPELEARLQQYWLAKGQVEQEASERKREVDSLLLGVSSLQRLQALWPEVMALLPTDFSSGKNLPMAVDVRALNEKLGLERPTHPS